MNKVSRQITLWMKDRRLQPAWFIFSLVLVTAAAYLPYIGQLGFYLDDWPHIFFDKVGGPEANRLFHAYDGRPLSAWFYEVTGNLIGYRPLAWQIFTLLARFGSAVVLWRMWRIIWPIAHWQTGGAALLFMVYPLFAQQPISVAFSVHWFSFLCFTSSLYLMVLALTRPRWFWPFTTVSLALSVVSLILVEYYVAVEALRIVWIWLLSGRTKETIAGKAGWSVKHWLPYAFVLTGFLVWRMFFIQLPVADRNETILLSKLIETPVDTSLRLIQWGVQDLIQSTAASWYKTLTPAMFDLSRPAYILSVLIWAAAGLIAVVFLLLSGGSSQPEGEDRPWLWWRTALPAGLLLTLAGPMPGWMIGRTVSDPSGMWNDRFGLAAMFGASLLLVALLELLITGQKARVTLLAILVGLAAGWQVRNANDYRWSWEYQKRVFNQFLWRMPYIMPDTLILSTYEYFPKMGHYPTAFALNTIYPQTREEDQIDFWYSPIPRFFGGNWGDFLDGSDFSAGHWQAFFRGHTKKSIIADYRKEQSRCVWVLGPEDSLHPLIDETTRESLGNSDLSRIVRYPVDGYPKYDVIPEMTKTWCYYFQKADLAAQYGDWAEVVQLWEESSPTHREMNASTELAPFIKGLVRTKNFDEASELTMQMKTTVVSAEPYLCKIWQDAINSIQLDTDEMAAANAVLEGLQCHSLTPGAP